MRWNPDARKDALYTFMELVDKAGAVKDASMDFGTGVVLTAPEMHALDRIAKAPGIHATAIAEATGVTRGAVSQLLARLERKGMLARAPDPENGSRLLLTLTDLGRRAVDGHERFHERLDGRFLGLLGRLSESQVAFLSAFLREAADALGSYRAE